MLGASVNNFGAGSVFVDPTDSSRVFLGTDGSGMWVSDNCGGSGWQHVDTGVGAGTEHDGGSERRAREA